MFIKIIYNKNSYIFFGGGKMLGKYVSTSVLEPIGRTTEDGFTYPLNFAKIDDCENEYAFIYGVDRVVNSFEGKVVAGLMPKQQYPDKKPIWIVAKRNSRPINIDILEDIDMDEFPEYWLKCLYETSCGAVVYRYINGQIRYLMIKNKRSTYWGWPKGHMEKGETRYDTARREVLEETGLHVNIHLGFEGKSRYNLSDKTDKIVYIYVASTTDKRTIIQKKEIDDYIWVPYKTAMVMLKFQNDRRILEKAARFLHKHRYIENLTGVTAKRKVNVSNGKKIKAVKEKS